MTYTGLACAKTYFSVATMCLALRLSEDWLHEILVSYLDKRGLSPRDPMELTKDRLSTNQVVEEHRIVEVKR